MAHDESESPPEKHERATERKLSTSEESRVRKLSTSEEPRVRTRSFNAHGTLHLKREFVGDSMDLHLRARNLVKKSIPKDNAIFRAVCEQISSVQTDHSDLRFLVEQILTPITKQHFKDSQNTSFERDIEILKILANLTSSRIIVYSSHSDEPEVYEGTEMIENREIQVCETMRSVYEPVYSAEIHDALAFSQSIVYRTLYEGVFEYSKGMINKMITYIREDNDKHAKSTIDQVYMQCDHRAVTETLNPLHSANALCSARPPQVPFCVCKSFDPSIYRNVEYTLYKKKSEDVDRAAQNSMGVKFGLGARCQTRDGPRTRYAVVVQVVKPDVRLVRFEDNNTCREFNVADLRPVQQPHAVHGSMPSLLNGIAGGPPPMAFLPGCMPPPPPPPMSMQQFYGSPPPMGPPQFPSIYGMPPPMGMHMTVPPPSSPFYSSPPPMYEQQSVFQFQDQMMMGGGGVQQSPPPPPPTPMDREKSMGYPPSIDSPLDTSVFPSTPLSSRSGDEGRRTRDMKPRALSVELTDSPTTGRPNKKTEGKKSNLTWYKMPLKDENEKRKGGRRATEGDTVGEMNRPLQPKQHRLSTCGSQENDPSTLPSLLDAPVQQMQQLQLQQGGAAAAAVRANLPSLLPLPPAQARPSYYASSEWTGSDTVFKDGDGNTSQLSLVNNHDGPLLSSSSMEAQPPSMGFVMVAGEVGGCSQISAPNFSMQDFYDLVQKDATYSANREGSDLPDMNTTRFFYNLGLQFYNDNLKNSIMGPPADALPMPSFSVTSPTFPPPSPAFLPDNMPFAVFHPSAAPPNTPAVSMAPPVMAPHLYQYMHPRVDGMPTYAWVDDGRGGGGQMMVQGPMGMVPSPSPLMSDGTGQRFVFH